MRVEKKCQMKSKEIKLRDNNYESKLNVKLRERDQVMREKFSEIFFKWSQFIK